MRSVGKLIAILSLAVGVIGSANASLSFVSATNCEIPQQSEKNYCSVTVSWHGHPDDGFEDPKGGTSKGTSGSSLPACLYHGNTQLDCAETGSINFNATRGHQFFSVKRSGPNNEVLAGTSVNIGLADYTPPFSWSKSTHVSIDGDFNGNGEVDLFVQPIDKTSQSGLMPQLLNDEYISGFHQGWTGAHPQVSAIDNWSQENYSAFSGNFNSNPGDELLLLGNKNIILLHGDIITPIVTFPQVQNAIVSWDGSNNASHTAFEFDANPADYNVVIGDLSGDGFDEIFLQAKSKYSTSYILSNTGSLVQTLKNGYLNIDWSGASYSASIASGKIILNARTAADDDNSTQHNSAGAVSRLENTVTKATVSGVSRKYVFEGQNYSFTPNHNSIHSVSFDLSGNPAWLQVINSGTGEIGGIPSAADTNKKHTIKLTLHEAKSHTVAVSHQFSIEVVSSFQITQSDYTVFKAADGTIYLLSANGVDAYKIVQDLDQLVVIKITRAEFDSASKSQLNGYTVQFVDVDLDGNVDLVLNPDPNSENERILIGNINGEEHTVSFGTFVEPAPEIVLEPIPVVDAATQQAGVTAGSFRVDESGAATYTVPIALPVGTAGVKPQLAVSYSSSGQNGLLGQGWGFSGISAITRCKQTQETDGLDKMMLGINFSNTDKFCLDGQRLILVNGTYGGNGSEYSTEINSFTRIKSHGVEGTGPSYFTVESKDGSIRYFGSVENSKLFVNEDGVVNETVAQWSLNKAEDNMGNYVSYIYEKDESIGAQRISEIQYTGNSNLAPYNFVYFDYETRTDTRESYVSKHFSFQNKRLERIRIESPHPITESSTLVKRYEFEYESSSTNNISLLNSIQECSSSDESACLEPTSFDWSHGNNSLTGPTFYGDIPAGNNDYEVLAADPIDFNGDGVTDLVYLAKVNGSNDYYSMRTAKVSVNGLTSMSIHPMPSGELNFISSHVADFNGDGKMDVLAPKKIGTTWQYAIYEGAETGLSEITLVGIDYDPTKDQKQIMPGDMNGDGLPDIVYQISETKIGVRVNLKESPGSFAEEQIRDLVVTGNPHLGQIRYAEGLDSLRDLNGDGLVDIINIGRSCTEHRELPGRCTSGAIGTGVLFSMAKVDVNTNEIYYSAASSNYIGNFYEHRFTDINGDGLAEILYKNLFHLNKGGDLTEYKLHGEITNFEKSFTVDYNGDGLMDIVYPHTEEGYSWRVRLSNGETLNSAHESILSWAPSTSSKDDIHLFGDFNGSGQISHLAIQSNGKKVRINFAAPVSTSRNQITKFTNGVGEFQEVTYKPLTDPSVYSKGSKVVGIDYGKGSPVFDILAPMHVVSNAIGSAPDHIDYESVASVSYKYANARVQAGGRGFLGFEKVYTIDDETGVVTGTKYRQDFPFNGRPYKSVTAYSKTNVDEHLDEVCTPYYCDPAQSSIIKRSITSWKLKTVSNGRTNFPYLWHSASSIYEGGRPHSKTTVQEVDDYNNVISITESTGTALRVTTTNEYGADNIAKWHLGRLTNSSVVTERPQEDQTEVPPITRESSFIYEPESGLLTRGVVNPNGSINLKLITAYDYDEFGNKTKTTNCSGHISVAECGVTTTNEPNNPYFINRYTRNVWDEKGRFIDESYNSLEQKVLEVTNRNINGLPTRLIDQDGVVVDKLYDAHGRLYFERNSTGSWAKTTMTQPEMNITSPYALIKTSTGSGAPEKVVYFDLLGRSVKTKTKGFDGTKDILSLTTYDSRGRVHSESMPYYYGVSSINLTTYQYDIFGRVTSTLFPNELTSSVDYSDEFAIKTTNQIGQTRTEERNVLGELTGSYENGQSHLKTTYQYDVLGKLKKTIDVDGVETASIDYDILGRKTSLFDRDTGSWVYEYNALGELVSQTDAKLQTTSFFYDQLGRMTHRVEEGDTTVDTFWFYDNHNGKSYPGKLIHETNTLTGFSKSYEYDSFGRASKTITHIPATGTPDTEGYVADKDYEQSVTYDAIGRVFQQFDASGNGAGVRFVYNDLGYLSRVRDTRHNESSFFYKINAMDAFGNITNVESGNGVKSIRDYDDQTGLLKTITTGDSGEVQALEYNFNAVGRLEWRESTTPEGGYLREDFDYDAFNRLTTATVNNASIAPLVIEYDNNGNIKNKSDVSTSNYSYNSNHQSCTSTSDSLHAVKQIGTQYFCYDENGNQTKSINNGVISRTVYYSHFNKPVQIENATNGHITSFQYGTDRGRYVRVDNDGSKVKTTHYIGGLEVHYKDDGEVFYKRSIGGRAIVDVNGSTTEIKYLHKDYQGSITAITDSGANPVVTQRMSFDPFGKRRAEVSWLPLDMSARFTFDHETTTRGYTGHEMLDEVGVIHMNGRTYDAHIGRFMQADIAVQDPGNGQNLNRYSYVLNSPMSYTDPSGYFYYRTPMQQPKSYDLGVLQIVAAVVTQGASLWVQAGTQAAIGYLATGDLRGAAAGAFSAFMFKGIGDIIAVSDAGMFTQALLHGTGGGLSSVLRGGQFADGFNSAFVVSLAHGQIDTFDSPGARIITAAIVGGTVSELTGGKFSNGAVTAAFKWAFNRENHKREGDSELESCEWGGGYCPSPGLFLTDKGQIVDLVVGDGGGLYNKDRSLFYGFNHQTGLVDSGTDTGKISSSAPEALFLFGGMGKKGLESFAFRGYGLFGRNGMTIGGFRVDAFYANASSGGGTLFSIRGAIARWRIDYGMLHGTGRMGWHSTIRFKFGTRTFGSTAQRTLYPPFSRIPKP